MYLYSVGIVSALATTVKDGAFVLATAGNVPEGGNALAMMAALSDDSIPASYPIISSPNADGSAPVPFDIANLADYQYLRMGKGYLTNKAATANGSFTLSNSSGARLIAQAGNTITVTPTADDGYWADSITVVKTGDPTAAATVVTGNSFTMPAYDVTVTVTFKAHTLSFDARNGATIADEVISNSMTLPMAIPLVV